MEVLPKQGETLLVFYKDCVFSLSRIQATGGDPRGQDTSAHGEGAASVTTPFGGTLGRAELYNGTFTHLYCNRP